MATRRNTRASSRTTSSREESPTIIVTDASKTPTKGRTRRSLNTPLPIVGLKPSTAYGTNNNVQPTKSNAPRSSSHIKTVLHEIIEPQLRRQSSHHSASPTIKYQEFDKITPDRSFEIESSIFRGADFSSSDESEEYCTTPPNRVNISSDIPKYDFPHESNRLGKEDCNFQSNNSNPENQNFPKIKNRSRISESIDSFTSSFSIRSPFLKHIILVGVTLSVFLLILKLLPSKVSSIENYFPESVSKAFSIDEFALTRRLSKLESEFSRLKEKLSGIDSKSIEKLEEILPHALVLKRKNGKLQIPQDFWQALRDKIRSDYALLELSQARTLQKNDSKSVFSFEKSHEIWDRYFEDNKHKIQQLSDENLKTRFPLLMRENQVVSRTEVIDAIRENWDKNSAQMNLKLKNIAAEFRHAIHDKKKQLSNMSSEELKVLAAEFYKYLPNAQLQVAAQVNLQNAIEYSNMKINHFTRYTGAIIDYSKTSPNYEFLSQAKLWFYERWWQALLKNPVPKSNPPEVALEKWYEHGDCWCSPAQNGKGFGPSLGVILGNKIYPEEIVVEHIFSGATMEPGAAPRTLELFAAIDDPKSESIILQQSQKLFSDLSSDTVNGLEGYLRLASWIYDLDAPSNIQIHEIPLDLKAFGVGTSKVIVRSKSNWGKGEVDYTCLYRIRLHGTFALPS